MFRHVLQSGKPSRPPPGISIGAKRPRLGSLITTITYNNKGSASSCPYTYSPSPSPSPSPSISLPLSLTSTSFTPLSSSSRFMGYLSSNVRSFKTSAAPRPPVPAILAIQADLETVKRELAAIPAALEKYRKDIEVCEKEIIDFDPKLEANRNITVRDLRDELKVLRNEKSKLWDNWFRLRDDEKLLESRIKDAVIDHAVLLDNSIKPSDYWGEAFLDRDQEIREIFDIYRLNYGKIKVNDRLEFVHINQPSGIGRTWLGLNIMNFNNKTCMAAVEEIELEEIRNWLKNMVIVRVDLSMETLNSNGFDTFHDYLNCLIWINACRQLFGINVTDSYSYYKKLLKEGYVTTKLLSSKLREMTKGRHLFIAIDQATYIEILPDKLFDPTNAKFEGAENVSEEELSSIGRYIDLMHVSKEWMMDYNCMLSVGRSEYIHNLGVYPFVPLPCKRSPIFLKPFTRDAIIQIVRNCKFRDTDSLISDHFGLTSEKEIREFSDWLLDLSVGLPRAVKTTLDYLYMHHGSYPSEKLDYRSEVDSIKPLIAENDCVFLPLDIWQNDETLSLMQLASLEVPVDLNRTTVGQSTVQAFIEKYLLIFERCDNAKVKIKFPWYWWDILWREEEYYGKLCEFKYTDVNYLDERLSFEYFVIYQLHLASKLTMNMGSIHICSIFPFLNNTVVKDLIMDQAFDIIYSDEKANSQNPEAWTSDIILKKCCETNTPKIVVPLPESAAPYIFLVFPRGDLPPLMVAIQCKNFDEDASIASKMINDEIKKFSEMLSHIQNTKCNRIHECVFEILKSLLECLNQDCSVKEARKAVRVKVREKELYEYPKEMKALIRKFDALLRDLSEMDSDEVALKKIYHRVKAFFVESRAENKPEILGSMVMMSTSTNSYINYLQNNSGNVHAPNSIIIANMVTEPIFVPENMSLVLLSKEQSEIISGVENLKKLSTKRRA